MEPTLGEIRMFAGTFAPRGWAFCEGQLLSIASNQALFSILGTIYGGDGRTTFALPDLRGRAPLSPGQGNGLTNRTLGSSGGAEQVILDSNSMPGHGHAAQQALTVAAPASSTSDSTSPGPAARVGGGPLPAYANAPADTALAGSIASGTVSTVAAGGGQPHENRQPWLAMNYIIATQGLFPSRG